MAPPHFQGSVGGGTSCAQRTSLMLFKKPSKLGFLQNPHPLCDITGYHPNYFLLGFRATPSIPTSKRSSSRFLERNKMEGKTGRRRRASRGLQGPSGASRGLQGPPGASTDLQGPPGLSRASRNLQGPPGPAGAWDLGFRGGDSSTLHRLPIVIPSAGVMAGHLQCLTTQEMGGNGLSRPGGNLGFRVGLAASDGRFGMAGLRFRSGNLYGESFIWGLCCFQCI